MPMVTARVSSIRQARLHVQEAPLVAEFLLRSNESICPSMDNLSIFFAANPPACSHVALIFPRGLPSFEAVFIAVHSHLQDVRTLFEQFPCRIPPSSKPAAAMVTQAKRSTFQAFKSVDGHCTAYEGPKGLSSIPRVRWIQESGAAPCRESEHTSQQPQYLVCQLASTRKARRMQRFARTIHRS